MRSRSSLFPGIFVFLLTGSIYYWSYSGIQAYRPVFSDEMPPVSSIQTLSPVVLKIFAGEFRGIAADFILFDLGARLGADIRRVNGGGFREVKKVHDWQVIHKLFVNCMALDPYFQQTYILAQGILPWVGLVKETEKILQTAADHRTWDWEALRFIGFNTYYFNDDIGKAGILYLKAAQTPNSPPFLSILGARLANKGRKTEGAIELLHEVLENKKQDDPDYGDILTRLHALEGSLVIEKAIGIYNKQLFKMPESIDELLLSGVLAGQPVNPYKMEYCIDQSGIVYFDRPDCRGTAK